MRQKTWDASDTHDWCQGIICHTSIIWWGFKREFEQWEAQNPLAPNKQKVMVYRQMKERYGIDWT
jgi:hypothetical protein